jgi:3-dehydroquinate synthase
MTETPLVWRGPLGSVFRKVVAVSRYDRFAVVIDKRVWQLHKDYIVGQLHPEVGAAMLVEGGEGCKTLAVAETIWRFFHDIHLTRRSLVCVVGGGSLGDVVGWCAANYMRGIAVVHVPTTLLSVVDSSIGGKTAINFGGVKNLLGAFHQPHAIINDFSFLDTLSRPEWLSGLAEMIKHALIDHPDQLPAVMGLALESVPVDGQILVDSQMTKFRIVSEDPTEQNLRQILNLGHTAGHAFEALSHRLGKPLMHGYAVGRGLQVAILLSTELAGLSHDSTYETVMSFLKQQYGCPHVAVEHEEAFLAFLRADKKTVGSKLKFVLLKNWGQPVYGVDVSLRQVLSAVERL